MAMDKSWITMPQNSPEYKQGVLGFIDFAFKTTVDGKIHCPCSLCGFRKRQTRGDVYDHLSCKQFPKGYTFWFYHGESDEGDTGNVTSGNVANAAQNTVVDEDPIQNMINDAFGVDRHCVNDTTEDIPQGEGVTPNINQEGREAREFYELARDGEQPLYEGCTKYSKLAFIVKLYHIKCLCGMTDKAMTMILEPLQDAFEHAKIPSSFYQAKKTISKLGLDCEKIDACPNHCMLYWGEDESRQTCKVCNTSRWKSKTKGGEIETSNDGNSRKKVPAKVLRYFPLKPRLQRLFLSSKTVEDMRWHAVDNNDDGMMRHPRDSEAWKTFDSKNISFASDPRNVRLALATDGFNPFGNLSTSYSIWPIILFPYNTPPWVCMKPTSSNSYSGSSTMPSTVTSAEYDRLKLELEASNDKLKLELEASNARVQVLEGEVAKVKTLEEQMAYLMQTFGGQLPTRFNQAADLGSPAEARPSSSGSHEPQRRGPSSA